MGNGKLRREREMKRESPRGAIWRTSHSTAMVDVSPSPPLSPLVCRVMFCSFLIANTTTRSDYVESLHLSSLSLSHTLSVGPLSSCHSLPVPFLALVLSPLTLVTQTRKLFRHQCCRLVQLTNHNTVLGRVLQVDRRPRGQWTAGDATTKWDTAGMASTPLYKRL